MYYKEYFILKNYNFFLLSRSRWDETPSAQLTPSATMTPGAMTPQTPHGTPSHGTPMLTPGGSTPVGVKAMGMTTPTPGHLASMTPEQLQAFRWEREIDERNRPYTDDELDAMFPPGFKVLPPPAGYIPIRTPARKLTATPTPMMGTPQGFFIQQVRIFIYLFYYLSMKLTRV